MGNLINRVAKLEQATGNNGWPPLEEIFRQQKEHVRAVKAFLTDKGIEQGNRSLAECVADYRGISISEFKEMLQAKAGL